MIHIRQNKVVDMGYFNVRETNLQPIPGVGNLCCKHLFRILGPADPYLAISSHVLISFSLFHLPPQWDGWCSGSTWMFLLWGSFCGRWMSWFCPMSVAGGPFETLLNRHMAFLTLPASWPSLRKRVGFVPFRRGKGGGRRWNQQQALVSTDTALRASPH